MAHVIGAAGTTAGHVEADRLLLLVADRPRSAAVVVLAAGAGMFAWATESSAWPGLLSLAFGLALVGVGWMLLTATPMGPWAARIAGARLARIALTTDLALGVGVGAVAGMSVPLRSDLSHHLWGGAAGLLLGAAGLRWRVRTWAAIHGQVRAGQVGEARTARELRRLPAEYIVFNDLVLSGPIGRCEIDHLVLGPAGIFVIEVKRWSGAITPGRHPGDVWGQRTRRGTVPRPSPIAQLARAQHAVAARLSLPTTGVTPIFVLIGGQLTRPVPVRTESLASLRRAIVRGARSWPFEETPLEVGQVLLPPV